MDKGLEIAKILVEPSVKLIDTIQGAVGKVYEPRHVRKMADAKAYEISVIGQAMREASDIPIAYEKGDLSLNTTDFKMFAKRTHNRIAIQELKKQYNIENVVDQAYQMLADEQPVTDDPVDSDWIMRYFNFVGDVSNEKMQKIWASILSGEIKKPQSFSLRTLETLHNISQNEAQTFQNISKYIISDAKSAYLPKYNSLLETANIGYSDILKMDECGLINSSGFITFTMNIEKESRILAKNQSYIIAAKSNDEQCKQLTIRQYPLTSVGKEVLNLFQTSTNDDFFIKFALELKKEASNATISLYKSISQNDNFVEHELTDLIEGE